MAFSMFRATAVTHTNDGGLPTTAVPSSLAFRTTAISFSFSSRAQPLTLCLYGAMGDEQDRSLCHIHSVRRCRPKYIPNHIPDPNYVRVFDTTLRDGEQSPGAALTSKQKLIIARNLAKLGVDVIEAGFPAASKEDFEAVKSIAKTVGNEVDEGTGYVPVICGLSRCNREDVTAAWEAVKYAKRPRIHIFISTSDIHMKHKLRKTRDEVIRLATSMIRLARTLGCPDIQFGAEDAGRSEKEFLYKILGEAIEAGATTVNIPDTVGINMPNEFGQLIADIRANTPAIHNVIISTHCHNDLGLSTANTIFGASAGARQVEVTINGVGERAGNASLEEVVMAMKCRGENFLGGLYTGIDTTHIIPVSKLVEEYTGLHVQPHKAIVGANAFTHESGVHQDGMLKHKSTYEIISPEDVGLERVHGHGIVLGKLSGRHALRQRLKELGYEIGGEQLDNVFWRFKSLADNKKRVTDADLIALVSMDDISLLESVWKLLDVQICCGTSSGESRARVKLMDPLGKEHIGCAVGTGPIDSAYKAVDLIVKEAVTLLEYSTNNITEGVESIATTHVSIQKVCSDPLSNNGVTLTTYNGIGVGTDIIVSSVEAYIRALNKMLAASPEEVCGGNSSPARKNNSEKKFIWLSNIHYIIEKKI